MKDVFGGSDSKSGNHAYDFLKANYGQSGANAFNSGTSAIEGLLGLSGGDPQALQKFWNGTGGQFLLNQGTNAINSNFYARGLGKSGAAMKALENYRSGLASTKLNELMQNYFGLSKLGLGAGDLLAQAGQYSKGQQSSGGLGSFLGAALAFI